MHRRDEELQHWDILPQPRPVRAGEADDERSDRRSNSGMINRSVFSYATEPACVYRSAKVALIIGTVLAVINHYDAILNGTWTGTVLLQIVLSYFVPYIVATYGSVMQAKSLQIQKDGRTPIGGQ